MHYEGKIKDMPKREALEVIAEIKYIGGRDSEIEGGLERACKPERKCEPMGSQTNTIFRYRDQFFEWSQLIFLTCTLF